MLKFTNSYDRVETCIKAVRTLFTGHVRVTTRNYYEILNLREDCSATDIRNAFIKLSKEMHPDKNHNDPRTHHNFVKLNEAYSVLSRPQKRNYYDLSLANQQYIKQTEQSRYDGQYSTTYSYPSQHYGFWRPGDNGGTEDMKSRKKISKSWIVFLCIIFTSAGVGLQVLAIRKSVTFSRDKLDKTSEDNGRILADVRRQANENGFEKQLQIMKQKIEDSVDEYHHRRGIDK